MTIAIDHSSSLPIHAQVEQLLRKIIELPQYLQREYLPGEVDLAGKLGISRNTIRQATNKLEMEGLISRKKDKSTRVIPKTVSIRLDNWHSFTQEMNDKGIAFIETSLKANKWKQMIKLLHFLILQLKLP